MGAVETLIDIFFSWNANFPFIESLFLHRIPRPSPRLNILANVERSLEHFILAVAAERTKFKPIGRSSHQRWPPDTTAE
jgi:hypothetical protein